MCASKSVFIHLFFVDPLDSSACDCFFFVKTHHKWNGMYGIHRPQSLYIYDGFKVTTPKQWSEIKIETDSSQIQLVVGDLADTNGYSENRFLIVFFALFHSLSFIPFWGSSQKMYRHKRISKASVDKGIPLYLGIINSVSFDRIQKWLFFVSFQQIIHPKINKILLQFIEKHKKFPNCINIFRHTSKPEEESSIHLICIYLHYSDDRKIPKIPLKMWNMRRWAKQTHEP